MPTPPDFFPVKKNSLTAPNANEAWDKLVKLNTSYRWKDTGFFSYHKSTQIRKLKAIRDAADTVWSFDRNFNQKGVLHISAIHMFILSMDKAITRACKRDVRSSALKTELVAVLKNTLQQCFNDEGIDASLDSVLESEQSRRILERFEIPTQLRDAKPHLASRALRHWHRPR